MLQRVKKWCKHSLTIAWGYTQILGSSIGMGLSGLGAILTDGDVKSAVTSLGINPKILFAFAVAGAITVFCRLRTVNSSTDKNNQVVNA